MAEYKLGDGIKKFFLAGVGAAAITVEKGQEIIGELVKKGELTVEQGKEMSKDLQSTRSKISWQPRRRWFPRSWASRKRKLQRQPRQSLKRLKRRRLRSLRMSRWQPRKQQKQLRMSQRQRRKRPRN